MRWWKFNVVGVLGWIVQSAILALLVYGAGVHYLLATLLAVEAAVLHNFCWHRRWTWADRSRYQSMSSALMRFHLTNGLVSMAGNLLFMRLLVDSAGIEAVFANGISIGLCAVVNFALCDRFAFLATAR
jgi:putative flippase GtrA